MKPHHSLNSCPVSGVSRARIRLPHGHSSKLKLPRQSMWVPRSLSDQGVERNRLWYPGCVPRGEPVGTLESHCCHSTWPIKQATEEQWDTRKQRLEAPCLLLTSSQQLPPVLQACVAFGVRMQAGTEAVTGMQNQWRVRSGRENHSRETDGLKFL